MTNAHIPSGSASPDSVGQGNPPKRPLRFLLIVLSALIVLAGVAAAVVKYVVHPEKTILKLQGSSTVGEELAPKMAESYLRDIRKATQIGRVTVSQSKEGFSHLHIWGDRPFSLYREVIDININGSSNAFKCLAADKEADRCDIGMSSRTVSDQDQAKYPTLENLHSVHDEHVIALDGIAVVVNPKNPVTQLTMDQLRDIYVGRATNWKEVGGPNAPIAIYGRGEYAGTAEMFAQIVLGKDPAGHPIKASVPAAHQFPIGTQVINAVNNDVNGIGYISSPLADQSKALAISDAGNDWIFPDELSIVTEDYPITRRLYLYDLSTANQNTKDFITYASLGSGQDVVVDSHYIALNTKSYPVTELPSDVPKEYREFTTKFNKLGLSFRFASGKIDVANGQQITLDNLAQDNIVRLQQFLLAHPKAKNTFLVIGFADNTGDQNSNYLLGLARANNVKNALEAYGIQIQPDHVYSFGSEMPVASNKTAIGRNTNRRVEVWVPKNVD